MRSPSGNNNSALSRATSLICRIATLVIASAALLAASSPVESADGAGEQRRPNIVVILADDMGYADVGFHGCRDIPTPNLDKLARQGVRCSDGYVAHPFCSPTRAALVTGRYQQRFGHENNPKFDPADEQTGLPLSETTIAQVLKTAGYATGAVGKWHLGAAPHFHPMQRGFDEYFGLRGGGHDYFKTDMTTETKEYLIPLDRNGEPVELTEYLTDVLSREAAAFVRRHHDHPFFLYLAYNAPHTPLQVSQKYLDRVTSIEDPQRRSYAAMVSAMDDGVGLVLSALEELKLDEQTLVFFLSDNGGPVGINGSSNEPFRGAKGQVFEGGVRVPFVVRWTGHLPAGTTYAQPVTCLDILPTAAAVSGATCPPDCGWDGVNLIPSLRGESIEPPHKILFWRTGGGAAFAVRAGRDKLVKIGNNPAMLFNLEVDPSETTDIAADHADRVGELTALLDNWNRQLVPPRWESPRPARPAQNRQRQQKRRN